MSSPSGPSPDFISRPDFEKFLHAFIHQVRNRLNTISLEAADLADQAGPGIDSLRLQQQVRDCSGYLKSVRDVLMPDDPAAVKIDLREFTEKLQPGQS